MQSLKEVSLDNLIKGYDGDLCSLNEYFFYCLRNSMNSRGITFNTESLFTKTRFLSKVLEEDVPFISNEFLKSLYLLNSEGLYLRVDSILEILPEDVDTKLFSSSMVDAL